MKKVKIICLLMACLILLTTACSNKKIDNSTNTIVDPAGDTVSLPSEITGVIARVNTASYIAALGRADLVKATYKYMKNDIWSSYMYPELAKAENLTGAPTPESFYELGANLCIWSDREVAGELRNQGIAAITDLPEDMPTTIRTIGKIFENEEWAENWISYYNDTLFTIQQRVENIENKKVVYYVHGAGNQGIYHTAAGGTISETWILQSGGLFATSNTSGFGIDITPEALVDINPDLVLIGGIYHESLKDDFYSDKYLSELSAVKSKEIYNVPVGLIPWDQYGVEYPLLCLWTAKVLYPDQFSDIDMIDETKSFYEKYCGVTLTESDVQHLLEGKAPNGDGLINEN